MNKMKRCHFRARHNRARGMTSVELAVVTSVFLLLSLGIIDFGRWLFAMNSAAHATQEGARLAVVCEPGAAGVAKRIRSYLIGMDTTQGNISVKYGPSSCNIKDFKACGEWVQVSLSGYTVKPSATWFLPVSLPVPAAGTFLSIEGLTNGDNAKCL